ncbi:hypothetical protein OJ998_33030 [Solirubrobacter taibaiensis]|nr:hypothetical protein [Solirubrobacter taibaiensis]
MTITKTAASTSGPVSALMLPLLRLLLILGGELRGAAGDLVGPHHNSKRMSPL